MNTKLAVAGVLLAGVVFGHAAEEHLATLRAGPDTYTNVTVTSISATEIFFTHSRGLGNAKLKNLDPELQHRFHFDPVKAAAQEAQQAAANAVYYQSVRNSPVPKRRVVPEPEAEPEQQQDRTTAVLDAHIKAKSFLNRSAPRLQVEQWLTEEPDTPGKWVLLDFWATWCGPCRMSIPDLNRFQARFKDRLIIIGLSHESEQQVRRMQNPKIQYSIAIDPQRRTESEVGVYAIPHLLLIDPMGIVRYEGHPPLLNEKNLAMLFRDWDDWLTGLFLLGG